MPRARKEPAVPPPAPAGGDTPAPPPRQRLHALRAWGVQLLLPLLLGAGLLFGLTALGGHLRQRLRSGGTRQLSVPAVECEPPPGMTREEFLDEVQYLAGLPDRLNVLDAATIPRLRQALTVHPWVSRVRRVQLLAGGRVRIDLDHRIPVLAVERPARVVDAAGLLLPRSAPRQGLPLLRGRHPPPSGPPGQPWGDPAVQDAAAVAALLRGHQAVPGLTDCTIDYASGELLLTAPRRRLLWGHAPGKELTGEAAADVKLRRLLEAPPGEGEACDLRPTDGMRRRPLGDVPAAY